jgi:transcriptional regulator with XRE-family HTH domain
MSTVMSRVLYASVLLTTVTLDRTTGAQVTSYRMVDSAAFYAALGRRIQAHRRGRFTQEQLASRLKPPLTRAAIANIEGGKQGVLVYTLVQIASHLGVPPADLLPSDTRREPPMSSEQLENELLKASVPAGASRRLTKSLFAAAPKRREQA